MWEVVNVYHAPADQDQWSGLTKVLMVYRMWEVVTAYQQQNDYEDATNVLSGLLSEFKDTVY